ncbi:CobW-like GTP-binding protein, partial [Staphylococcus epidermidis]|uniref:CobW-like GTP-binding protein n=1 Tax=Staphylococcus epidermidis TaxID=1282 RepID=UPI0021B3560C
NHLVTQRPGLSTTDQKLLQLSNGSISSTLTDDFLRQLDPLLHKAPIHQILIQSTPISHPLPLAQTFSYIDKQLRIHLTS